LTPLGCQSVTIEYRYADGQYNRLPELAADLVRRQVSVIVATANTNSARAAKTATETIPIVFSVGEDPVKLGLVASLARPGGNATGVNYFLNEIVAKRLGLLRELLPAATRFVVMVNPSSSATETTLQELIAAGSALGVQVEVIRARDSREIEAAFVTLTEQGAEGLFVAPDTFFATRRVQIATLAASHAIPAIYTVREYVEVGGLISYGTSLTESTVSLASTRHASSRVRSLPICRSYSRLRSNSSSTCRPHGPSASKFRRRCSPALTR
jgi:putative ABC transport system substrate-binding protein